MSQCSAKTAKHLITETTLYDSLGSQLVFWCQRYCWDSTGVTPDGFTEYTWGRWKWTIFDQYLTIL